jgi:hypothetical protein
MSASVVFLLLWSVAVCGRYSDRQEPSNADLTLAYTAGFWTAALLALFLVTIWR